jgi:glycosyltransferase involved in cell wall biosynthesis
MKLVILIPVHNEEEKIKEVINSLPKNINNISSINIVVVNDGSTDNTYNIIKDLDLVIINHPKNFGLGRAFQNGLQKALELDADILVNIDGDGQFDVNDIPKLIKPIIEKRADFVTASRFANNKKPNMPKIKYFGNLLMSKLISYILNSKYEDVSCGFRVYNKEAMCRLNLFGKFTYTQEVFLDLGYKGLSILEIPIEVKYFTERKSRIAHNLFRYAWQTLKIILRTVVNYKPLKFFGSMGIFYFTLGLFFDIILLIHYLQTSSLSPYKIFGFIGIFFNTFGIILILIGLLSDMIHRIRLNQEEILYRLKK